MVVLKISSLEVKRTQEAQRIENISVYMHTNKNAPHEVSLRMRRLNIGA